MNSSNDGITSGPPGGIPGPLGQLGPLKRRKTVVQKTTEVMASLSEADQQTVLDFASFLSNKSPQPTEEKAVINEIPRPKEESVIAAIRRLSQTYPMLDRQVLFDQTSSAMSAHILNEVSSEDSIDRLEQSFSEAYQRYLDA